MSKSKDAAASESEARYRLGMRQWFSGVCKLATDIDGVLQDSPSLMDEESLAILRTWSSFLSGKLRPIVTFTGLKAVKEEIEGYGVQPVEALAYFCQLERATSRLRLRQLTSLSDKLGVAVSGERNGLTAELSGNWHRVTSELWAALAAKAPDPPPPAVSLRDSDIDRSMVRQRAKMKWLAEAMTLVQQKPHLSDAAIAGMVKRHPATLSRNETYRSAAAMAREYLRPPRGSKNKEGEIEAELERDDFAEME